MCCKCNPPEKQEANNLMPWHTHFRGYNGPFSGLVRWSALKMHFQDRPALEMDVFQGLAPTSEWSWNARKPGIMTSCNNKNHRDRFIGRNLGTNASLSTYCLCLRSPRFVYIVCILASSKQELLAKCLELQIESCEMHACLPGVCMHI